MCTFVLCAQAACSLKTLPFFSLSLLAPTDARPPRQTLPLLDGHKVPALGFGTWQAAPGQVGQAVIEAVKAGYRQ